MSNAPADVWPASPSHLMAAAWDLTSAIDSAGRGALLVVVSVLSGPISTTRLIDPYSQVEINFLPVFLAALHIA